jgi:hypothetical protein
MVVVNFLIVVSYPQQNFFSVVKKPILIISSKVIMKMKLSFRLKLELGTKTRKKFLGAR